MSGTALCVDAARRDIAQRLRNHGFNTPDLDARILVSHALGLDHTALVHAGQRRLEATEIARIETLAARRLAREPIARITGIKEFWSLPLRLDGLRLRCAPLRYGSARRPPLQAPLSSAPDLPYLPPDGTR